MDKKTTLRKKKQAFRKVLIYKTEQSFNNIFAEYFVF